MVTLLSFPSIDVYHGIRSCRCKLSLIMRVTNSTSPPGAIISTAAPVHAENGTCDFVSAELNISSCDV